MASEAGTETRGTAPESLEQALEFLVMKDSYILKLEEQIKSAPFNPFTVLSVDEVLALTERFTDQWRKINREEIRAISAICPDTSEQEILFAADLRSTAKGRLLANQLTKYSKQIEAQADEVLYSEPKSTRALNAIADLYSAVPEESRGKLGIKVRDLIMDGRQSKSANAILEVICKKLNVKETDWMR